MSIVGGSGRIPYIQGFFKGLVMHTGAVLLTGQTDSGVDLGGGAGLCSQVYVISPKV